MPGTLSRARAYLSIGLERTMRNIAQNREQRMISRLPSPVRAQYVKEMKLRDEAYREMYAKEEREQMASYRAEERAMSKQAELEQRRLMRDLNIELKRIMGALELRGLVPREISQNPLLFRTNYARVLSAVLMQSGIEAEQIRDPALLRKAMTGFFINLNQLKSGDKIKQILFNKQKFTQFVAQTTEATLSE